MKLKLLLTISLILLMGPLFPSNYAIFNSKGEQIIDFSYSEIYPFFEDLALCKRNNLYGYIDKTGKEIIPFEYSYGEFYQTGAVKIAKNNDFYYINKENKPIFSVDIKAYSPKLTNVIESFKPYSPTGLLLIEKDGLCGIGDTEGNIIIPCEYNRIINCDGDLFLVSKNNKFGYIDKNNKIIIPISFGRASEFKDGFAIVTKGGKTSVINTKGETVAKDCDNYLIYSPNVILATKNGKIGAFNKEGKQIIAFEYSQSPNTEIRSLKYDTMTKDNGCFILFKNGSWFLFNKEGVGVNNIKALDIKEYKKEHTIAFTGNYVVDIFGRMDFKTKAEAKAYIDSLKVKSVTELPDKYSLIKAEGTSLLLDRNWKEIVPQKYDIIKDFKDNLYIAKKNYSDKYFGMVDIGGDTIISFDYEDLTNFNDGCAIAKAGDKYGLLNTEGTPITKFVFDYIDTFLGGFARVKKGDNWGVINNKGEEIIPCEYKDVKIYPSNLNDNEEIFFVVGK